MAQWVMSLLCRLQSLEHSQRQAGQLVCAIPAHLERDERWRQNPRPASLAQPRWASRNNICCPLISAYVLGHALTHTHKHICMHICTHIADNKIFCIANTESLIHSFFNSLSMPQCIYLEFCFSMISSNQISALLLQREASGLLRNDLLLFL